MMHDRATKKNIFEQENQEKGGPKKIWKKIIWATTVNHMNGLRHFYLTHWWPSGQCLQNYCRTIQQAEVECEPRTITNVCDIIDRLRERETITAALQNISEYNMEDNVLAQKSREWMHRDVTNTLLSPYTFHFDHKRWEPTTTRTFDPEKTVRRHKKTAKVKSPNNDSTETYKQFIRCIISHHVDDLGKTYYITYASNFTDYVAYVVDEEMRKNLQKQDQQKINQYNATKQMKHLYEVDAKLMSVMGYSEKCVNNEYAPDRGEKQSNCT